jgi:hypothetical protein
MKLPIMRFTLFMVTGFLLFSGCVIDDKKVKSGSLPDQSAPQVFQTGLTEDTACLLSQVAYSQSIDSSLRQYLPGWSLVWEGRELNGNHAFVAGNGREFALAVRGSLINFSWAAFQNWIYQDLHVTTQVKWAYSPDSLEAKVSAGSYTGWQNLQNMTDLKSGRLLLPVLDSVLDLGAPLLITGHSLGGNLATVYGSFLTDTRKKNGKEATRINVITFGAPAAGNAGFATDFNQKFPNSVRVENVYDIVPKFPSASRISALSSLFNDTLSASRIQVGYNNLQVPLSRVFGLINSSFTLLEFTHELSPYEQTNGDGKQFSIPLSGKNTEPAISNWLNEAGFHHSIRSYAAFEKVPRIPTE